MPASSARLLLTRPEAEAAAFAAEVARAFPGRFEIGFAPLTRIVREPAPLVLDGVQALLFTSANGVRAFAAATDRRDLPALCVGPGTAAAARAEGLAAESAEGDAGALARMAANAWLPGAGAYLHVRGRQAAGDLAGALAAEGIEVREAVLYDAAAVPALPAEALRGLEAGHWGLVLFFSPRAARLFAAFAEQAAEAGRGWALRGAAALAISAAAAAPLAGTGFGAVRIAPRPDAEGMLAALALLRPA